MIEDVFKVYADVEYNKPLSKMTTLRVGGNARFVVYPKNELCLARIIELCTQYRIEYKIFGKGSNLLCSDNAYDGAIICLDRYLNDSYFENDGTVFVYAGCSIIQLSYEAMRKGFSGLEFASGIPGTVGGAIYMNAGAYKTSISEILEKVYVYRNNKFEWIDACELGYCYRTSVFQEHSDWIIIAAVLKLKLADSESILNVMNSRKERRISTQPLDKPSAGSMFRNPNGYQAWELIEKVGLRGKEIGGAKVSLKHCNFIINHNNAKAQDIEDLVTLIQTEVHKKFNVQLKREVEKFNWKI